jgi:hypothetical protein
MEMNEVVSKLNGVKPGRIKDYAVKIGDFTTH